MAAMLTQLPGGVREQEPDMRNVGAPAPAIVRQNQLAATSVEYKKKVFADGIPHRPSGLFPPGDELLTALASDPRLHAFEKHVPGESSPFEQLPKGGWATGDATAARGVDMRLFYQEPEAGQQYGTIRGAVRFGDGACIADGFYLSVHGGAIETVLDESTAELSKLEYVPVVTTREATFQLIKPIPAHRSLLVTCRVKEQRGLRMYVEGAISSTPEDGGSGSSTGGTGGTVFATCTAMLVNIRDWL